MNNPVKIDNEKELVTALVDFYKAAGSKVVTEVQLFERFIDILIIDKDDSLIAIEAKINSPSKAFQQAERYRYVADNVYVATPKNRSNKTAIELANRTGIGLILISKQTKNDFVFEIVKSPTYNSIKKISISNYIKTLI